jgi:hypothetical protein
MSPGQPDLLHEVLIVPGIFSQAQPSEWNECCSSEASRMNRKPLVLAIVLIIAALAPATAIIGFCARMPCCSHAAGASAALSTERADCCTTITCYESPSAKLTIGTSPIPDLTAMPTLVSVAPAQTMTSVFAHALIDPSPPITLRHRLAILSTLLI